VALPPGDRTGLQVPSQVMVDKVVSVPREAVGRVSVFRDPDVADEHLVVAAGLSLQVERDGIEQQRLGKGP
jgi:hypothetical protein